jgi:hypothetical protein
MMYPLQKRGFIAFCLLSLLTIGNLFMVSCSFNISTANMQGLKTCSKQAGDKECAVDTNSFPRTTKKIFATADLNNATDGTKVKVGWKYLGGEAGAAQLLDSVDLEMKSNMSVIISDLTAGEQKWPTGDYEVVFTLNTDNSKPLTKKFSITK